MKVVDLRGCCLQTISLLKAPEMFFVVICPTLNFLHSCSVEAVPYLSELMLDGNALLSCKDGTKFRVCRLSRNLILAGLWRSTRQAATQLAIRLNTAALLELGGGRVCEDCSNCLPASRVADIKSSFRPCAGFAGAPYDAGP